MEQELSSSSTTTGRPTGNRTMGDARLCWVFLPAVVATGIVFVVTFANKIEAVRERGVQACRDRLAALSRGEQRLLREALAA